jgi:hypothetical protein
MAKHFTGRQEMWLSERHNKNKKQVKKGKEDAQ